MDYRRSPPAIPGRARLPLAVVAVLCAATVALLSVKYSGIEGPGRLDVRWGNHLTELLSGYQRPLRSMVTLLGPPTVAAFAVLTALVAWWLNRERLALVALIGPLLTGIVTSTLQPLVGRTLDGGAALPSGHTAGVTAAATVAALLAAETWGQARRWVGPVAAIAVAVVGAGMAAALITNGLHVLTDTVAGFCTAVAVVVGVALSIDGLASFGGRLAPRR